ncbi:MAG: DUF1684 domain-containing protein [Chitinophagales bacterium]|nr:DUF1684 domain-containing protein [Chitinophagales bacterium]
MRLLLVSLLFLLIEPGAPLKAQDDSYADSLRKYQDNYVKTHEVVTGKDKDLLHFFPVNDKYRVKARIEKVPEAPWFKMETSGKEKKTHRVFAIASFMLHDTLVKLHIYQSQQLMGIKQYAALLFIPFTDRTSGEETYANGRYIDASLTDIKGDSLVIDFNKAYNPYCAYVSNVYNCPMPPPENDLPVAVRAGEMKFSKPH